MSTGSSLSQLQSRLTPPVQETGLKQEIRNITAEFILQEGGYWYMMNLSMSQYVKLVTTGSLPDGRSVAALKLFEFPETDQSLIYDFTLARKGVTPWRTTEVNV